MPSITLRHALVLLLLPPLAFAVLYATWPPATTLVQPDSHSYINFTAIRTGGYPFFLALFKPFVNGPAGYIPIQLSLNVIAVAALGWQLYRGFGIVFAFGAEIVLLINPFLNVYHFTIMTESLSVSLLLLLLAATAQYLRTGGLPALAIVGGLVGALIAVRPTGIAFLPIVVLLPFCRGSAPVSRRLLAVILPCLALVATEVAYYHAVHPGDRDSLAPIHILAKGGLVEVPDATAIIAGAPAYRQPLDRALEDDLRSTRQLIDAAPDLQALCRMLDNYETFIQYRFALPERDAAYRLGGRTALLDAGMDRILTAPLSYARLSLRHLECLWTLSVASIAEKEEFHRFIDSKRPIPFEPDVIDSFTTGPSPPGAPLLRAILVTLNAVCAIAGLLLLIALLQRHRPPVTLGMAGLCGIALHANLLITAMAGVSIPRYPLSLWPLLMIGTGAFLWWALRLRTPAVP